MDPIARALLRSFRSVKVRNSYRGIEVSFPCPKCGHGSFSFNSTKKVGQCFRAKCQWTPRLDDLRPYLKASIRPEIESFIQEECPSSSPPKKVALPEDSEPLVWYESGEYRTKHYKALMEVAKRGVLIEDQYTFDLHVSNDRVYIPVYQEGELVNFVGRLFWWLPFSSNMKYLYFPGAKTSDYLFNWDTCKKWNTITFVENTFNAIWLHKQNVTTNFGSSFSNIQLDKIANSGIESVVLLWDEDACQKAEEAVSRILSVGISSCYIKIKGQPDNYPEHTLRAWMDQAHKLAKSGKGICFDAS